MTSHDTTATPETAAPAARDALAGTGAGRGALLGAVLVVVSVIAGTALVSSGPGVPTDLLLVGLALMLGAVALPSRCRTRRAAGAPRTAVPAPRAATAAVLRDAVADGSVRGWHEQLEVRNGTVDHVVMTGSAALVVTSCRLDDVDGLSDPALAPVVLGARWRATQVRTVAAEHGILTPVHAVVAVWGDGALRLPAGGLHHGTVLVLAGTDLRSLLALTATTAPLAEVLHGPGSLGRLLPA